MKEISLYKLYKILESMENSDFYTPSEIEMVKEMIQKKEFLLEDTSATGGPAGAAGASSIGVGSSGVSLANATIGGMGPVQSSQPSAFPGALNGVAWASGGGERGSGDISVPYNPSGANRMFQKLPAFGNKKQSDPNVITKKSRVKGLNFKTMKDLMSKKPAGKIMNFNDFENKDITTKVTKVKQ
jgi:hypothetical protein